MDTAARAMGAHTPENSSGKNGDDAAVPLKVVIAYDCVPAGQRAIGMLNRLLEREIHTVELAPSLWRIDFLHDPLWGEKVIADIHSSDLLVLSAIEPARHPSAIENWVSTFLSRRRGASTAILSLFGSVDEWTISIQESCREP